MLDKEEIWGDREALGVGETKGEVTHALPEVNLVASHVIEVAFSLKALELFDVLELFDHLFREPCKIQLWHLDPPGKAVHNGLRLVLQGSGHALKEEAPDFNAPLIASCIITVECLILLK